MKLFLVCFGKVISNMFELNKNARALLQNEKKQFEENGYIKSLPVFSKIGSRDLQAWFEKIKNSLPPGIDINKTNMWHKASKSFYDICNTRIILDYVESLLGRNFYLWGGQFFFKGPNDKSIVPWHQDAQYWPLKPSKSVTVWLAVYDTDESNAAMKVVSSSHKKNSYMHKLNDNNNLLLNHEVSEDQFDKNKIVSLNLKAGEMSLHTDALLHCSDANYSDQPRCGITMRFSPTNVKADLEVWPSFSTQLSRGVDKFNYNPVAPTPRGEATPVRGMQHHSDFEKEW